MNIQDIIMITIVVVLFLISLIMGLKTNCKNIPVLINILKNENRILFPIGILMLVYQIYKSGEWELSQNTNSYLVVFMLIINAVNIFIFKLTGFKGANGRVIYGLCISVVFTPAFVLFFLLMVISKVFA